ncbi:MAG: hypothetical protein JXA97_04230 [Anaerolineales bacterium]|nr:hypothetical protein [Anaerolineales bacterium]
MLDETRPFTPDAKPADGSRLDDTRPLRTGGEAPKKPGKRRVFLLIPAVLVLVLLVAVSLGYVIGKSDQATVREQNAALSVQEQFDLSVEDLLAGRFELAKQRLEYVLSLDPQNPDAAELLGMVLTALNQPTPTASPAVTNTPTVTPNTGSSEETFASAQIAFANQDWNGAINLLMILRSSDPEYRRSESNQILATALRNRGMDKLFQGYLEQGIYDLNLAAQFGPLDAQAASWQQSAAFYIFANSYIGLDWRLAAEYMGQMCQANIWGACAKFANAAREYANLLVEDENWCDGSAYYAQALGAGYDVSFAPTATEAASLCMTATAPSPTISVTPTGSATLEVTLSASATLPGAATPTPSRTPTPTTTSAGVSATPGPTATPSPTSTPTPTATEVVPPTSSG